MNKNNCQTIINDGIDQLIHMVEKECSAWRKQKLGAMIRNDLFRRQWKIRGEIRLYTEWYVLQPHKRFQPGRPIVPNGLLRKCSNILARRSPGYQWLQALERCIEETGVRISTEYFTGGLSTSTSNRIMIRPFMTTRGRFHCLVREYAHMRLNPDRVGSFLVPDEETRAQAVAFAVARAVGLESQYHSRHYIVGTCGDANMIRNSRQRLNDLGSELLTQLFDRHGRSAKA